MSVSSYLASRHVLIWCFLSGLLGSAKISLSLAPFFVSSTDCRADGEVAYVSFFAEGGQGVPMVSGLAAVDLSGVLPPYAFNTFAACSCTAFSLKHPTYVSVAFSHAKASRWLALIVIMPLGHVIFIVA
jgi:hypothetical protein